MYSKLTNETFYTMADAFANSRTNNNIPVKSRLTTGYCNLNSDTFLRHLSAYSIDFYEDGVNGYQLRPFYDNSWSSRNSINEAKENQSLPFQMVLRDDITPGTFFHPDGSEVKKTHLDNKIAYLKFHNTNIVYSTSHTSIPLMDYLRNRDQLSQITDEMFLTLGSYSIIYLHNTKTLIYDPDPITAYEPDMFIKEERYQYISELAPIAKMYIALHPDNSVVESHSRYYNKDVGFEALTKLYEKDITPSDFSAIAANDSLTDKPLAIGALTFIAKHLDSEYKEFNNWVNGIVPNRYPFLLYKDESI